MKRFIALMLAAIMAVMLLGVAAVAEEVPIVIEEEETTEPALPACDFWVGNRSTVLRNRNLNLPDDAVITSVKSSKVKRLKATLDDGVIVLQPLKTGKAKITVKYKSDGATKSISATYTVNKYPKPLGSLVINGKSVNLTRYKFFYELNNYEPVKTNITFKPNSGWIVSSGTIEITDPASPTQRLTLTSGKSFNIPDGKDAVVRITLENAKGQKLTYIVNFSR